jgi:uncharacterized protein YjbI with pentapeptide repeats
MAGKFLGKWLVRFEIPLLFSDKIELQHIGYGDAQGPGGFVSYDQRREPFTPPNATKHVAFILRADGQLCFQLNNGKYVGRNENDHGSTFDRRGKLVDNPNYHVFRFVDTLEAATGFAFRGQDANHLPSLFKALIANGGDVVGTVDILRRVTAGPEGWPATAELVTPPLSQTNDEGNEYTWVDFSGLNLQGYVARNSNFSNCNFTGADLSDADLTGSNFSNCNFTGASLMQAFMDRANLTGAIVKDTTVGGAFFRGATLANCDWSVADSFPRSPVFYSKPAGPPAADHPLTILTGCRLSENFLWRDWSMLDLTGSIFVQLQSEASTAANPVIVKYSKLQDVTGLEGASLKSAVFDNSMLDGLELSRADLTNASFMHASMRGTNLSGAILE